MTSIMVTEHAVTRTRDAFRFYVRQREQEGNRNGSADPTGCMRLEDFSIRETCVVEVLDELAKKLPREHYPQLTNGEHDLCAVVYPNEHNKYPIPIYLLVKVDEVRDAYDYVVVTALSEYEYNKRREERELVDKIAAEKAKEAEKENKVVQKQPITAMIDESPMASLLEKAINQLKADLCEKEVVVVLVSPDGKLDRAVGLDRADAPEFLADVWGEYPPDRIRIYSLSKPKVQITF